MAQIGTSKTLLVVGIRGNLGLIIGTENIPTVQDLEVAKAITVASRDSPLPSPAVDATGLPVSRTALHSNSIAKASAKLPAESLSRSYPRAAGFFFGNTELGRRSILLGAGLTTKSLPAT